jgi:anti-sigma factor ChrR (cupin superfamily)
MREMKGFITIAFDELDWQDDTLMTLPKGVKSKILSVDEEKNYIDQIHKFPPGYVEPRHTHNSSHNIVILEGTMVIDGKTLKRGGYVYAEPNIPHGPYVYPDGCTVFIHFEGPSPAHKY